MVLTSTRDRKPALRRAALKILALSQSGVGEAAFLHALQVLVLCGIAESPI